MNGPVIDALDAPAPPAVQKPALPAASGTAARNYGLLILTVIYALSFVDRAAIGLVQEPIKAEFGLSDFQLGLLGGPAFAILYSALGLPLAHLAGRVNRITIISVSLAAWSMATAFCGLATSYMMLLAGRLGVSIGEAGCVPPSQSVIVDSFPPSRRATALAIYGLGVPASALGMGFIGGWLADRLGWRAMFLILGLSGVLIALLLKATLRDPPRAFQPTETLLPFRSVMRELAGNRTFWNIALGASMTAFVGYALAQYFVSFMMRTHGLSLLRAAQFLGVMYGLFGGIGTFLSGYLCDRLSPRWPRIGLWLPAIGMLGAAPLFLGGYLAPSLWVAAPLLFLGAMFNYFYLGPMYAVINSIVTVQSRTVAMALAILMINLIGYGLGPPIVGFLSDALNARELAAQGLSPVDCAGPAFAAQCSAAAASGLRTAVVISLLCYVWAGIHFLLGTRSVSRDWKN